MKKTKKYKKKATPKKKSYYKPKKKKVVKKTSKKPTPKKKYKSYYKPKKKNVELNVTIVPPLSVKDVPADDVRVAAPIRESITPKRPVKYLNNRDLLAQVIKSKQQQPKRMTNDLAKMLQLLTSRYAKKGNFANYTYNEDMQSYAMLMLVKTWDSFDPAKSSNPFAFFTQCIKNSFIQYLNSEKRQRDIKDEVLVDKGMSPSFGYAYDYEERQANAEPADQEVVEAPTKLHEDVDNFSTLPDSHEEDPAVPESY